MKFSAFCNKVPNMAHTRRMFNEQILMSLKCFWSARFPKGKMMIKKKSRITEFYNVGTLQHNRNTAEYP